jgi:importin subunit alpha-1
MILYFNCFSHRNASVQTPALRAIGNIVTGDDSVTQHVVDIGVLGSLKSLLSSPKQAIQKEACWAVSNITAGTLPQIRAVYENQIFPILIHILANSEPKTKREACWALCNATSCFETAPDIIRYLVSERIIPPLCAMLRTSDSKILQVAMDGIENILQVGEQDAIHREDGINQYAAEVEDVGAMDDLYELQSHYDSNIYLKSKAVIEKFFGEDEEINLEINEGQQKFSF